MTETIRKRLLVSRTSERTGPEATIIIIAIYMVTPKSKPLPNYQNIVLNRIKACQWD